jgi:hypothetical protein
MPELEEEPDEPDEEDDPDPDPVELLAGGALLAGGEDEAGVELDELLEPPQPAAMSATSTRPMPASRGIVFDRMVVRRFNTKGLLSAAHPGGGGWCGFCSFRV